jgi:membrane-bound serine protease (ClpP class)
MPEPTIQLAVTLLAIGLVVLILELFIPSAGTLFAISMVCIVSSMVVAFWVSPTVGLSILAVDIVLAIFLPGIGLKIWRNTPMGRRMFLEQPAPAEDEPHPLEISADDQFDYRSLVGQRGVTVTPLRPAGTTDFDGRRVDTVSEGVMIDRGRAVRVVSVEGSRVVVRQVDIA